MPDSNDTFREVFAVFAEKTSNYGNADIQPLINTYHRKLADTDLRFKRYLHNRINWNSIATCRPSKTFRKLLMVIAENVPLGPKKIYLNNTDLMYALAEKVSEGTLRETFFANQTGSAMTHTMPRQGDFMADGKYLFEVGGSRKTFSQIADLPDCYLALDDIETGSGNRIPLSMFGMMY